MTNSYLYVKIIVEVIVILIIASDMGEPIVGAGKDPENKLTVQKSIPLFSLWRSDMTLAEFKILDTYLSRINSREPLRRTVVFTKGELEGLLGVSKINKSDLTSRLNGLARFVELEKEDHKIHKIALFEEVYGEIDENGLWSVKLTCTPTAMKYVFNVEKLGYLRYKLRCITSLTSRYTYVLFMYLESNRFRKSWEVSLNELRELLNCTAERYTTFKFFNAEVLKRCQAELQDKTECRFTYESVKTGRRVTSVRFTLETLADSIESDHPEVLAEQLSFEGCEPRFKYDNDYLELMASACAYEFNNEQMMVLVGTAGVKKLEDIRVPLNETKDKKFFYLSHKYDEFKYRASKNKIPHRFEYFKTMLEND